MLGFLCLRALWFSSSSEQFIKETDLVQEIDAIPYKVDHKEIHTV